MIVFDPLWKTIKQKNISQYKLIKEFGISPGQITRLKKNNNVNTHTINHLCDILDCELKDVMEYKRF